MNSLTRGLLVCGVGLGAYYGWGLAAWKGVTVAAAVYLLSGGWKFTQVVVMTFPRDMM